MFNDVFRPMPQQAPVPRESFTEGAEEPFEAMEIEEVTVRGQLCHSCDLAGRP